MGAVDETAGTSLRAIHPFIQLSFTALCKWLPAALITTVIVKRVIKK